MKKVLMLGNSEVVIYNFRYELIERMIKEGYEVYVSFPYSINKEPLKKMGCKFINTPFKGRNTNILEDSKLFFNYMKILKKINPDIVLTYTVKPNVYGGIACRIMNIPYICNITGLGSGYLKGGIVKKIIKILSKISFEKAAKVFFQNNEDKNTLISEKIIKDNYDVLPGSGVNLKKYKILEYKNIENEINFNFIGRIMKDKGIDEYLEAARKVKIKYPKVNFNVIGKIEEKKYESILKGYENKGVIKYYGFQHNINSFIKNSSCTINPSYSEGMSNVLLESAACGRAIIASNISGCKEIIDEGITGYTFKVKDIDNLIEKIETFINLSHKEKILMGLAGRAKVENEFDRNIVVNKYMNLIKVSDISIIKNKSFKLIRVDQ